MDAPLSGLAERSFFVCIKVVVDYALDSKTEDGRDKRMCWRAGGRVDQR